MSESMQDLNNFERLGIRLKAQREAAELTLDQLAQLLRLTPKVVAAIEAGDESQLPKRVFILGYIHSYIRALELDEQSFAEELAQVFPKPAEMSSSQRIDGGVDKSEVFHDQIDTPIWQKGLIVALVVIVITAVLAYIYLRPSSTAAVSVAEDSPTTALSTVAVMGSSSQADSTEQAIGTTDESAGVDRNDLAAETDVLASESATEASTDASAMAENAEAAEQASTANQLNTQPQADSSEIVLPASSAESDNVVAAAIRETIVGSAGQRLELNFNAECWVEVKRADGSLLVGDLFNPNRRLIVNTDERVSILLGYGPAASVTFAGEAVEFRVRDNASAFFYVGE
ncbi:helix-turn-helix domain-containing protein [Umboniibacter marinipuniceus]|uniref:Cytoskeletal protein RodZ n=1 Tax=Umboniibacter marinipuniceus TaxID=569599 RepID=A0A3M0A4T3_9GAMM|nr:helix-turn-helix domain-containing protein [Umboniibacter marinipuniceus]RMA79394.1 cytoskeletal protein RodZ [Umboniibacter marinipuniceus]